ncbi:FtsX-like permease family protein [Microbacterium protaetiae]|uniref:FtsX-like permease family protein n=1 Tax=Microbacterium protaetiae TaxID=2509458 RepID=UPI001F5DE3DD|nr:FtsX-like permease family protein [Microbacterium protaetiae]
MPNAAAAASIPRRIGSLRRVLTLTALLARPTRQGRAALVLPVVAFAVTTALLLTVVGGTRMFLTDPRATGEGLYGQLGVLALILLAVPVATLGAAAARLSSRRRNDRLATLRLLGASSAEVSAMTVLEAGATAFVGALAGVAVYALVLPVVGLLPFFGGPIGVAAVWTGWGIVALTVGALTVLATVSAAVGLRRVRLTPLGVRQRTDAAPRRVLVIVIATIALGVVVFVVANLSALGQLLGPAIAIGVLLALFGVAMLIINLIGAPIVAARGRAMARRSRTAAHLIAGRELAAHASTAWRRVSAIAMISFIAVIGGVGVAMAGLAGSGSDATLFADVRTGVLVTLAAGFLLLACSVGVTQAASVLEDRALIVGLDRLGMPERQLRRARRLTVLVPLRWAALGGAAVGVALSVPVVGVALIVAPASLAVVAVTFVLGFGLVLAALAAVRPLLTAVRREA